MKTSTITKIKTTVIASLFLSASTLFAQDAPKKDAAKVTFKPTGAIAISYNPASESAYFNFGGPGVRLEYGKFSIAYHMYPSLRYFTGDVNDKTNLYRTRSACTPILGTGFQLGYKKIAIVLPFYYLPTNNVWLMSVGLGYKL